MQRKRLLILTVSTVAVVAFLVLHTFGVIGTGVRLESQTISRGYLSGIASPTYYVIQDIDEWAQIWSQHVEIMYQKPPLPEVDFSRATVIAVFMGKCPSTGHGIWVKEVIDTGLTVVVKVEQVLPGESCIVGTALTQPYHMVKVDRISKYIIFNTLSILRECVPAPQTGPQASITSYPVRVSLQLKKTEFQQNEIINVTLSLTNINNETVTLWKSHYYFYIDKVDLFDFIVRDSNDTKLFQWTDERYYVPSTWSRTLEPNEQLVNNHTFWPHHLQPGTYSIMGILSDYSINGSPPITLETPSITFKVR